MINWFHKPCLNNPSSKRLHLFLWRLLRQTETSGQNPRMKLLLVNVTVCYVINKNNNVLHTEERCDDK